MAPKISPSFPRRMLLNPPYKCVKLFKNLYRRKSEKRKLLVVLFVERVSNDHGDF